MNLFLIKIKFSILPQLFYYFLNHINFVVHFVCVFNDITLPFHHHTYTLNISKFHANQLKKKKSERLQATTRKKLSFSLTKYSLNEYN